MLARAVWGHSWQLSIPQNGSARINAGMIHELLVAWLAHIGLASLWSLPNVGYLIFCIKRVYLLDFPLKEKKQNTNNKSIELFHASIFGVVCYYV